VPLSLAPAVVTRLSPLCPCSSLRAWCSSGEWSSSSRSRAWMSWPLPRRTWGGHPPGWRRGAGANKVVKTNWNDGAQKGWAGTWFKMPRLKPPTVSQWLPSNVSEVGGGTGPRALVVLSERPLRRLQAQEGNHDFVSQPWSPSGQAPGRDDLRSF
jgi:hypothetical protein